jgi:3',5'-cyclic AMP phosphodiesterase CpdA
MLKPAALGTSASAAIALLIVAATGFVRAAPRAPASALPPPALITSQGRSKTAEQQPFSFSVISDLNQGYGSTRYGSEVHVAVSALTERFRPGLVLITGDMVAGQKRGVNAPAMWQAFHAAVTEPLERAQILVAPAPGNHDASPSFATERAEYIRQWSTRRAGLKFIDDSGYPLRYSFSFQGAFFLALDAASVGPLSNEQRAWVEAQLARANEYAVKVAFGHLPLYPIARGREREIINDAKLEAIFERYGVELYASGHQHAYYPGATTDMRHLSMPCLGAGSRALIGTARRSAQALVMVKVESGEISSIDAYSAPDFMTPIARSSLPRQLSLGGRVLWRDDLVPTAALLSSAAAR